ncbi:hypothetical protein QUF72_04500 [Desulfobacterales bacterium HSG2]|nr:hypothetical protein [Desulfobacterales bacterium HSG2]
MSSDKRPHTTYIDYLRAAETHIAACKELRKRLKEWDSLYHDHKDKHKIKRELYYLSGYIIECMVCYAVGDILDELNPEENIHEENILSINKALKTSVSSFKKSITFNFLFKEGEHKIEKKLKFIKEAGENNIRSDRKKRKSRNESRRESIPILDHFNLHKDDDLSRYFKQLYEKWLPHARYKLSDEIENILKDDELIREYIEFTIQFANMIRRNFNHRTKRKRK